MIVELLKYPNEKDWEWVRTCTMNTIGKKVTGVPKDEWKVKLIKAEHSPLRELWFGFRLEIPYWVSVHFVRHHIGINHYVQTQRNDRQNDYDRSKAPQDAEISHIVSVNAQELVQMAHKRLCAQASKETREVMQMMVDEVVKVCPEFKDVLVPLCEYRNGVCTEFYPCGRARKTKWISVKDELPKYWQSVLLKGHGSDLIMQENGETFEQSIERTRKTEWKSIGFLDTDGWCDYNGFPLIVRPEEWCEIDWSDIDDE